MRRRSTRKRMIRKKSRRRITWKRRIRRKWMINKEEEN